MFIVYKIVNLVNAKYYIGVHKTTDVNDNYMGSGTAIKSAIRKHGIENFEKQILAEFVNKEDAYKLEYLLTDDYHSNATYNMKRGGIGDGLILLEKALREMLILKLVVKAEK